MANRKLIITITIALVLLVAGLTRMWKLTEFPVSLTMDEVAIGYGSYSLLQTGMDERGNSWPLAFYSVGDYKPPVNFYILMPFIATLGLTEFAVRIPVALMSTASVGLFMLLIYQLNKRWTTVALSGLWLAVLPWHIHYSRFGTEAITAMFFLLIALTSYFQALKTKSVWWLIPSAFGFSISVWAYHSNRLFITILCIGLLILSWKHIKPILSNKHIIWPILVVLIFAIPFLHLLLTTPAITERARMTSILSDPNFDKTLYKGSYPNIITRIFDHDFFKIYGHWLSKYLDYYDPRYLFWKGIAWTPRYMPGVGLMHVADIILFVAGAVAISMRKRDWTDWFIVFWLFIGPITAAFTMNDQHPLRTIVWLPAFGLFIAWGLELLLSNWQKLWSKLILFVYAIGLIFGILYATDMYLVQFPRYMSEFYSYGFKQAAVYACEHQDEYDSITISPIYGTLGPLFVGLPDYYVMFYCQYPPHKLHADGKVEKFNFYKVDWRNEREAPGRALLISTRWDYPEVTAPAEHVIQEIKYPDGQVGFYIIDTGPDIIE